MNKSLEIKLYKCMKRIRLVEEEIALRYHEGKMRCPVHLSIGQELVPAVASLLMDKKDYAVSTHRCHAHFLAKQGNMNSMIAEIYGKKTGCSKGKGGSMHLIDLSVNFMGSSAIVGNSIPTGVGLGLASKLKNDNKLSFVFLGDGAIEEGVFYESINFAALKKLPVIFICENNLYSVYSPLSVRQPKNRSITKMVKEIGIETLNCIDQNPNNYYKALKRGIEYTKSGKGPFFLEYFTYRWREHCGPNYDNDIGYRDNKEYLKIKKKDPLKLLEKSLNNNKYFKDKVSKFNIDLNAEIKHAFQLAENDDFPDPKEAFSEVYATK